MDPLTWSGTVYSMMGALQTHCGDVVPLGPVFTSRQQTVRAWREKAYRAFGRVYDQAHSLYLSQGYAREFAEKLRANPVDVIFAPAASTEIALLRTRTPVVYLSDATFAVLSSYYEQFSNLFAISRWEANFVESLAIRKAARIIYASTWARDSALADYRAKASKIHVIPFGANMETPPDPIRTARTDRAEGLRLLFVGVEWQRKGGPVAVEALLELQRLGVPATLTIVGCKPPKAFSHERIRFIPFLSKSDPAQRDQLSDIYRNSDAFLLPTRAECAGVVFAEAAAYRLPVFATATGGVPSVVEHGVTGMLFPPSAGGREYANAIAALWRDERPRFEAMAAAGRKAFETRLNWDAWGRAAAQVIRDASGT